MDAGLVDAVMAQLTAALGVVGKKILTTAEDDAAEASTRLGLKLLARLRRKGGSGGGGRPELEAAVSNAAAHPDDEDFVAALRGQLKLALAASDDPALGEDLAALLKAGGASTTVTGDDATVVTVAVNDGIMSFGKNATNTQNRK